MIAPTFEKKHEPAEKENAKEAEHQDDLIDEAIEETFPASDPIAPIRVGRES